MACKYWINLGLKNSTPDFLLRYVVCRGLKPGADPVREYLFTINLKLNQLRDKESDVSEVVPLDIIKGDTDFFNYMIVSNEK